MSASTVDRIAERLTLYRVPVAPAELEALSAYYDLVFRWNARMNLTALRNGVDAIDRLIVEPVLASQAMPAGAVEHLDVGSGGGSPAFPVLVMRPAYRSTLVESRTRKAAFLREAARTLGRGDDVRVEARRLEEVEVPPEPYALVTVRAVRLDLEIMIELERLASPGVELWYFAGPSDPGGPARAGWNLCRTVDLLPERRSRALCFTWNTVR